MLYYRSCNEKDGTEKVWYRICKEEEEEGSKPSFYNKNVFFKFNAAKWQWVVLSLQPILEHCYDPMAMDRQHDSGIQSRNIIYGKTKIFFATTVQRCGDC